MLQNLSRSPPGLVIIVDYNRFNTCNNERNNGPMKAHERTCDEGESSAESLGVYTFRKDVMKPLMRTDS